jgi:hypothetical protein
MTAQQAHWDFINGIALGTGIGFYMPIDLFGNGEAAMFPQDGI